jgi:hypothetical protein
MSVGIRRLTTCGSEILTACRSGVDLIAFDVFLVRFAESFDRNSNDLPIAAPEPHFVSADVEQPGYFSRAAVLRAGERPA